MGSGSAALSAALRAATGGLSVTILEKAGVLGGTSAMSGAGTWVPANHHAAAAGIEDSTAQALEYISAASPPGWRHSEDPLWIAFCDNAPKMLKFIEDHTPLRFALTEEPDTMAECPGGKQCGRMLSPGPLRKALVGRCAGKIRSSTLPQLYTYQEVYDGDLYHRPVRATLIFAHRLLWRLLTNNPAQGGRSCHGTASGLPRPQMQCRAQLAGRRVSHRWKPRHRRRGGAERP
jgi:3-oxosteroid 1-dehydrogenase